MTDLGFDPRITPWRADLAAEHLEGQLEASRFAAGAPYQVCVGHAALRGEPGAGASMSTELLYGETFTVYEIKDGWAWGQATLDDYVGYVEATVLQVDVDAPTHRVSALRTFVFPDANIKAPPIAALPLNAKVSVAQESEKFSTLMSGGFVFTKHLRAMDNYAADFVEVARMFLNVPYLWGGKTSSGADCSGVMQAALEAAGIVAPRDTDMQEAGLGVALPDTKDLSALARGDLVCWRGHIGVMVDGDNLLHANATSMSCVVEPLAPAVERIARTDGPVTTVKRLS